jgi:lysozyme family protein
MAIVFTEEGGYTNDPNDRGGPTNFGITIGDLKQWREKDVTAEDVKNMTKDEAREIYRSKYWNPMQCGDLPNGVDLEVFDFGVNAGTRTAIKKLQDVLGLKDDGSIGPITISACKAVDPRTVIQGFSARRLEYYRSLGDEWTHFGAGWTNRTNAVEKAALKMVSPQTPNVPSV